MWQLTTSTTLFSLDRRLDDDRKSEFEIEIELNQAKHVCNEKNYGHSQCDTP